VRRVWILLTVLPLFLLAMGCTPAASDDDDSAGVNDDDAADDDDTADDDDDAADDDDTADDDDSASTLPEELGVLLTTNAAGRSGAFFLPARAPGEPLPIALLFHPTGGAGASMRDSFLAEARATGFAIVAPDSRVSPNGDFTWEVGTDPGEVTPDLLHAQACWQEVLDLGITPSADVLAAGHSGGASSAPYLASNDARFSHFAVLHGGVFVGGLGSDRPAGWLATGEDDTLRPPAKLQGWADSLAALGFDVTVEIFPGGHGVSAAERVALVDWWLP
jgi:predicted esterase